MTARVFFEPLRSIAFGGISGVYAALGDPFVHMIRAFCITNRTDADMIFASDNTNADGDFIVIAGSYKLYDLQSNINPQFDDKYVLPIGTQIYVKQKTAPVSGNVYVEFFY